MSFHPPPFTGNAPVPSSQNARDLHIPGCDPVEPLDVFPRYSDALQQVITRPLPAFLLEQEAPPPVPEPPVQHGPDIWSHLRHSIYNKPRPHAVQQAQAREVEDAFDINRFLDRVQTLNPENPYPAAAEPPGSRNGVQEAQEFDDLQIITYTPVPAAYPAPPRCLLWLDGGGEPAAAETGSENQVVLCASNAEDAQPPAWALG